jgi:hypothetical protein
MSTKDHVMQLITRRHRRPGHHSLDYRCLPALANPASITVADAVIIGNPDGTANGYDLAVTVTLAGDGWTATLHAGAHVTRLGRAHRGLAYHPEHPGQPLAQPFHVTVAYDDQTERQLSPREAQRVFAYHRATVIAHLRRRAREDNQTLAELLGRQRSWAPHGWHRDALRTLSHQALTS